MQSSVSARDLTGAICRDAGLMAPLLEIEMRLPCLLADMERTGLAMDTSMYSRAAKPLERRLEEVKS